MTEQMSLINSLPLSASDPMGTDDTEKSTVHEEAIPVQDLVHCNFCKMMSEYGCVNTVHAEAIPVQNRVHCNFYKMMSEYGYVASHAIGQ